MAMLDMNNHLCGRLVGIGKILCDGSTEFKWLEKPIGNRIVRRGLDHLLTLNGNQTTTTSEGSYANAMLWIGRTTGSQGRCGALTYVNYGASDEPTSFSDTGLHQPLGSYSDTLKTTSPMCGTQVIEYGKFLFRVTHIHSTATSDVSVNELGWFYDIVGANPAEYRMFSRVVLDAPYELRQGEQLITTYEVKLVMGNREPVCHDSFFGLLDSKGNPLQYATQLCLPQEKRGSNWNASLGFPYITTSGDASLNDSSYSDNWYDMRFAAVYPPYCSYRNRLRQLTYNGGYCNPFDPNRITGESTGYMDRYNKAFDEVNLPSANNLVVHDYQWGSFYRDVSFTVPSTWPKISGDTGYANIQFFMFGGVGISFGHYEENDGNRTWVPQYYRKYGNKNLGITVRYRVSTDNMA